MQITGNWNDMQWEIVREGVMRKIFTGEGATLSLNSIKPGHDAVPHKHIYEQLVYIIEGECDFYVEDKKHSLQAGGLLYVPPNAEHYIVAKGDKVVINLDIFSPKRTDYVK